MDKFEYTSEINKLASYLVSDALEENGNDIEAAEEAILDNMIYWAHDAWEHSFPREDEVSALDSVRAFYAMRRDVTERVSYIIEQIEAESV